MKETVLLTGANGFVGRHLHRALREKYRVVRLIWPPEESIAGEDPVFHVDLSDSDAVKKLIPSLVQTPCRSILHLAAVLCKPGDWDNIAYFKLNNAITLNMIHLAPAIACSHLINFSSLAVYPNRTGVYNEKSMVDMADNTECLYGLAKFNAEMLFRYYLKSKMKVTNLRMAQVFGPGMQADRLIGILAKELRETNRITLFGNGERVSNFVDVVDVAQAVLAVLSNPAAGTYNLGNETNMSYLELAKDIMSQAGKEDSRILLEEKGVRARVEIDTRRFEKQFQYACRSQDLSFLKKGGDR
ncbi:MAG: NAD(P)-dependent oxidoreductase [Desulfobacteraceae bacterium]|nr:MAG: NAD(P)-dependent oxidoreductase [Desulfobacteraceae bacterium]